MWTIAAHELSEPTTFQEERFPVCFFQKYAQGLLSSGLLTTLELTPDMAS
jgi:hypothetical protein